MAGTVLVINAGSSSVKFQLFDAPSSVGPERRFRGQVEGVGNRPRLVVKGADGAVLAERDFSPEEVPDAGRARQEIDAWLDERCAEPPAVVGHRVVHGGPKRRISFPRPSERRRKRSKPDQWSMCAWETSTSLTRSSLRGAKAARSPMSNRKARAACGRST